MRDENHPCVMMDRYWVVLEQYYGASPPHDEAPSDAVLLPIGGSDQITLTPLLHLRSFQLFLDCLEQIHLRTRVGLSSRKGLEPTKQKRRFFPLPPPIAELARDSFKEGLLLSEKIGGGEALRER